MNIIVSYVDETKKMNELISKLNNKSATIAIIGLGYVGLPLMLRYAEIGYKVIGIDIDPEKSKLISQGQSYIKHIHSEYGMTELLSQGYSKGNGVHTIY